MRIGSIIIFHLSKLWKAKFFRILASVSCNITGEIDHFCEWKGFKMLVFPALKWTTVGGGGVVRPRHTTHSPTVVVPSLTPRLSHKYLEIFEKQNMETFMTFSEILRKFIGTFRIFCCWCICKLSTRKIFWCFEIFRTLCRKFRKDI